MVTEHKLNGCHGAKVIRTSFITALESNRRIVIEIDNRGWLSVLELGTKRTKKHIEAFLAEFAPLLSYENITKMYLKNIMFNIFTYDVQ